MAQIVLPSEQSAGGSKARRDNRGTTTLVALMTGKRLGVFGASDSISLRTELERRPGACLTNLTPCFMARKGRVIFHETEP